jgi:hypothetical protein
MAQPSLLAVTLASRETLEDAFTWHVERTLSRALTLQYDNRTFDKIRHVKEAAVVENKRLGPLLEIIHQQQLEREPEKRSRKGPKRRDQTGHMFSVG